MSISDIYDILHSWLDGLLLVWDFFTYPIADLTTEVLTQSFFVPPEAAAVISGIINLGLPRDASLITVMLGHLVIWYIGYQLLSWFLGLVT